MCRIYKWNIKPNDQSYSLPVVVVSVWKVSVCPHVPSLTTDLIQVGKIPTWDRRPVPSRDSGQHDMTNCWPFEHWLVINRSSSCTRLDTLYNNSCTFNWVLYNKAAVASSEVCQSEGLSASQRNSYICTDRHKGIGRKGSHTALIGMT